MPEVVSSEDLPALWRIMMSNKETPEALAYAKNFLHYEKGCLFHSISRCSVKAGQRAGTARSDGYRDIRVHGVKFLEHRVIWAICMGAWPPSELDHIDRNPANNSIDNLRIADRYINTANTNKRITNNSGHKNIYWNPINSRWRVAIRMNNQRYDLGSHIDLTDAISVRDTFIKEHQHASCAP